MFIFTRMRVLHLLILLRGGPEKTAVAPRRVRVEFTIETTLDRQRESCCGERTGSQKCSHWLLLLLKCALLKCVSSIGVGEEGRRIIKSFILLFIPTILTYLLSVCPSVLRTLCIVLIIPRRDGICTE